MIHLTAITRIMPNSGRLPNAYSCRNTHDYSKHWAHSCRSWSAVTQHGRRYSEAGTCDPGQGSLSPAQDELHQQHPDLLPAWYAFRDTRARRRAVQWLADSSLIDDGAADRFLSGHPDPDLP